MNITFINGSPKSKEKESASKAVLNDLKSFLSSENIFEIQFNKPKVTENQLDILIKSDVLVFSFPLYVDSVPSNLLACLVELEQKLQSLPVTVYAICNNGFYEAIQNRNALKVIKNWTLKTKLLWGQGLGVGAGGMLLSLLTVPPGKGPKKNLGKALVAFSENIKNRLSAEDIFINPNFPRFLYIMMAHYSWKQQIKKNGGKVKDLYRRL